MPCARQNAMEEEKMTKMSLSSFGIWIIYILSGFKEKKGTYLHLLLSVMREKRTGQTLKATWTE